MTESILRIRRTTAPRPVCVVLMLSSPLTRHPPSVLSSMSSDIVDAVDTDQENNTDQLLLCCCLSVCMYNYFIVFVDVRRSCRKRKLLHHNFNESWITNELKVKGYPDLYGFPGTSSSDEFTSGDEARVSTKKLVTVGQVNIKKNINQDYIVHFAFIAQAHFV